MSRFIATKQEAADLVGVLLDPHRTVPIIGVAVGTERTSALIDVGLLQDVLGPGVEVHALRTGDATWELKRTLPAGLDVYGDALRVWQPGLATADPPDILDHPLLLLREGADQHNLVHSVADMVHSGGRREHGAVVTELTGEIACLRLEDGTLVEVPGDCVSRYDVSIDQVLRPAQRVRVLLTSGTARQPATGVLLPFEPDPHRRITDTYGIGDHLLVRVLRSHPEGAFVELLPGEIGLLRTGTPPKPGTVIPGRITHLPPDSVALVPADRDARTTARAASLLPDGPPWLASGSSADLRVHEILETASDAWTEHPHRADTTEGLKEISEVQSLEELVDRADQTHLRTTELLDSMTGTVHRLRSAADQIRHDLEHDLIELRVRVLRTLEQEHYRLEGTTLDALESARAEVLRLRQLLADSETGRARLEKSMQEISEADNRHQEQLRQVRSDANRQRNKARALQRELDELVPAEDRLRTATRESWLRHTTKADRERYPWRDPKIGPEFLGSLERLEGVSRQRVVDVCAEVICGRALVRTGLQVHQLRASRTGGSAQRIRNDGARAFRASLQVRSAAARRLHYWELPDGGVELAKVGYHDDFTIV